MDTSELKPEVLKRIHTRMNEIKRLYEISEAEMMLIQQLAMTVKLLMGTTPKLTLKLLRGYTAMVEMMIEEIGE